MPTMGYLPLYDRYFRQEQPLANWDEFKSQPADFTIPLSKREVDFSLTENSRTWCEVAGDIAILLLKMVIPFWGLYCLAKYITQRIIMLPLYPVQNCIVNYCNSEIRNDQRELLLQSLNREAAIVRSVVLEKNGVRYSGLLIGHRNTIENGKWVLQACGNGDCIENSVNAYLISFYRLRGFNTLLINGPGVGMSQGTATPNSIGDAQQVGISFLETAIKANKIAISGFSLGGAAVGQAILKHTFKENVRYLVVRKMTFDQSSRISGKTVEKIVEGRFPTYKWHAKKITKKLVKWTGCEMDSVAVSRQLQQLQIKEVIVQASNRLVEEDVPRLEDFENDGIIHPCASLGYRLIKEGITENKVFCCLPWVDHGDVMSAMLAADPHFIEFSRA